MTCSFRRGFILSTTLGLLGALVSCGQSEADEAADATGPGGGAGAEAGQGGSGGIDGGYGGTGGFSGMGGSGGLAGSGGAAGASTDTAFEAEPTLSIVHASPNLFPFRVCLERDGVVQDGFPVPTDEIHYLPESNFPGVAVGGLTELDPSITVQGALVLHLLRADSYLVQQARPGLGQGMPCEELMPHLGNTDKIAVPVGDLGAWSHKVRALVVHGCRPEQGLTAVSCGESFDPTTGNLEAELVGFSPELQLEPTTTHVFAAHVSPSLSALQEAGQRLGLVYGELGETASQVVTDNLLNDPGQSSSTFTAPFALADFARFGFTLTSTEAGPPLLRASLPNLQRVSAPYDTPADFFASSNGILLLAVGDATEASEPWLRNDGTWNPLYDGRGLHLLALQFNFVQK
jgi:hypothetical protein